MLDEHVDIIVDELPSELLLVRSISHHIDLIPGAIFPNKVAYRLIPLEHELLEKGLVKESLSPCDVPTALSPKKDG